MFTPSRDEARRFIVGAWRKFRAGEPLSGLEQTVASLVAMHPEYHAMIDEGEKHLERDWSPEGGAQNPFLHLSMHLSISEQVAVDQPRGIKQAFELLAARRGSAHEAQHEMMECLGEMIWESQRSGRPPDGERYVACVQRRATR